ncbi:hypothetical protein Esti_005022 [Eimeria stiedai]
MALIGSCCGRAPAEAEKLPLRVPLEMAEDIQKNTRLSLKEIQGLYNRFRKYAPSGRLFFSRFCDTLGVLGMLDDTMIAERMFRAFDKNQDRELSFTEFATALGVMMRGTDDQKLNLSFRILNPAYTGTGECLDDYRYNFATRSESGEEPPRSPSRHALSEPGLPDVDSPDTADDEDLFDGWEPGGAEQNAKRDLPRAFAHNFLLRNNGRVIMSSSRLALHLPGDANWFERNRDVIYADSLGLHEFLDLVRCLQESRRALLGGEGLVAPDEEIAMVFLPLASEMPDGSRRMMLKDFKQAVRSSPRFLCVLGVAPAHVSSPSLHSGKKQDRRTSLVSSACPGASFALVGASPSAADVRASVQAQLLRQVRQAEARAEMQQRKQQQQHRQQLERLAAGLRAVEKDVEAVKSALARGTFGKSNVTNSDAPVCIHTTRPRFNSRQRACCLCARDCTVENRVSIVCCLIVRTGTEQESAYFPTKGHSECLTRCAMSAEAALASAAAEAATVAAAAAVTALKQAEQQLNRILEESTLAAYRPLHIVDQLLMGIGGTCCVEAPQQDPLREGPQLHEQPYRARKSIVRSRPVASHEKNAEAEGDCATETPFAVAFESCRQQKVSFFVGEHAQQFQGTPRVREIGELAHQTPLKLWRDQFVERSQYLLLKRDSVNIRRSTSKDEGTSTCRSLGKDAKGLVVHFGHESWNMVINIMVGIRLAGGRAMSEPHRNVEPYDFVMKEKFSVLPKTGMVDRKPASLCAVRFIDYAPMVFRRIRAIFGVDSLLYIRSVGPEQLLGNLILGNLSSLSELVSEGKSGSLFYYTTDGRFMIKTVSKETASFMRSILFDYYKHVSTCTNTMLTRFCGLHAIRLKDKSGQILGRKEPWRRKTYFMVMENFFHSPVEIHRRYDLKGSTKGRSLPRELLGDSTVARKDNDMTRDGELASGSGERSFGLSLPFHLSVVWNTFCSIEIGEERKRLFIDQLALDATFLRDHGIMDYSLLLGISYANRSQDSNICQKGVFQINEDVPVSHLVLEGSAASASAPGSDFERPFWNKDLGGMHSSDRTKLYYVGIIDILTHWNAKKKLEHVGRVLQCVPTAIFKS